MSTHSRTELPKATDGTHIGDSRREEVMTRYAHSYSRTDLHAVSTVLKSTRTIA
jgi:hypothetical protein